MELVMNLLCCLYLGVSASYLVPHDHPAWADRRQVDNPYLRPAVGLERDWAFGAIRVRGNLEVFHMSSVSTRQDQGDDGAAIGLKVFFGH